MKPFPTRLPAIALALALLTGCAAQKQAAKANAQDQAAAFLQAEKALADRRFIIELNTVYTPEGNRIDIQNSSLTMRDSRAEVDLSPELFRKKPHRRLSDLQITDKKANLQPKERKKNGDTVYELSVSDREATWKRDYLFSITLFADSDACLIQVRHLLSNTEECKIRGTVRPLLP